MKKRKEREYDERLIEIESQPPISKFKLPPIVPLNDNQKLYISQIKANGIVIAIGSAGTSKTFLPSCIASEMLLNREIDKIVICRPAEGPGKYLGHTPGSLIEKLEEWMRPVSETLKGRLGHTFYEYCLKSGKIEYCDLNRIKGRSFDDCMLIIDEAEDIDIETMKSVVTRIGIRSKIIINGDIKQKHIYKDSGLGYLIYLINKYDLPIPIIEFTIEDCVRSEIVKMFLTVFEKEEENLNR